MPDTVIYRVNPVRNRTSAASIGGSFAIVVVWLWNTFLPGYPMPVEIGTALGAIFSWLPTVFIK